MVWQLAVGSCPSLATRCIIDGASDSGDAVITSPATLQTQLSDCQPFVCHICRLGQRRCTLTMDDDAER